MKRTVIETSKGVSGISRPFKGIIEQIGLQDEDRIIYVGLPGVCTPFIELLAYAIRKLQINQTFVPDLDLRLAKNVVHVENIGIQFGDPVEIEKAKVIVVLGGLAMPISPVGCEEVSSFLQSTLLPGGTVIGVSFMNMFEQVGWTLELPFDFWIDAIIDPVKVERFLR
ncbi:MAG: DUF2124 family protein [Halobacteriota archaeon]